MVIYKEQLASSINWLKMIDKNRSREKMIQPWKEIEDKGEEISVWIPWLSPWLQTHVPCSPSAVGH